MHRDLKASLMATLQGDPNWADTLPVVLMGMRAAFKPDIRTSAAELVLGEALRLPAQYFDRASHVHLTLVIITSSPSSPPVSLKLLVRPSPSRLQKPPQTPADLYLVRSLPVPAACHVLRGLNYVPFPKTPPVLEIIGSFEQGLSSTEQNKATEIKFAIADLLLHHRCTQVSNLDRSDMRVLRNLKAQNERMITKADKDSTTYTLLRSDPTDQTRKALRSLLLEYERESKEGRLSTLANHLKYSSSFKCPEMYGLPKIHKPDVPFRRIVCSVQSITHELCSYLKSIIQPVVGKRESAVKNCKDFVEQIRLFEASPSDILVSYDVKDLFYERTNTVYAQCSPRTPLRR
ncbi:hypothetical protein M514_19361 [Trichuris suis]|uniref:Uncharacterized protein n=1 Tax=Trichuris suis TaxID=68888 RepID=A0A085NGD9_9BILA|nr:hypothetical protein M514_19361 [Trichuris suis]